MLGEAVDELGVADLLGTDGVYILGDGDGGLPLRLLNPADGSVAGAESAMGTQPALVESALEKLAASAATAYAPAGEADGTAEPVTPSNWLVSASGQVFLLVGGVNVIFESHLSQSEISAILARHGVPPEHVSPLGELPNARLVQTVSDVETLRLAASLSSEQGVDSAVPNLFTPQSVEPIAQSLPYVSETGRTGQYCGRYEKPWGDKYAACLWHLNADTDFRYGQTDPKIDINLGNVWDTTMGAGVTVAVVDHAWEPTHEDIADNVDSARSKIWGGYTGENPDTPQPYHGTAVAGIVAARDNSLGGRGVAPRATLVNYNYVDSQSSANFAASMTLNKATVAAYNLSFGTSHRPGLSHYSSVWRKAVEEGLSSGFGGKGSSYVKAAGNGARTAGRNWATLQDANNHRGVITVCAVNSQGTSAAYSNDGPSLWLCAPSRDDYQPGIVVPIGKNGYTIRFGGTSSATPIVSGVIALMRSVNKALTWRDVKVILANTAQKNDPDDTSWMSGAAKYGSDSESYSFSYQYGFGTVDAKAAVDAASSWTLLPPLLSAQATSQTAVSLPSYGNEITLSLDVQSAMDFIEHVQIDVNASTYDLRDYRWTLVSPSGAESLLSPEHTSCPDGKCGLSSTFRFGSSRHLGEDPSGTWKLKVRNYAVPDPRCNSNKPPGYCSQFSKFDEDLKSWKLVISGHSGSPTQAVRLSATPSSVAEGAEINVSVTVDGTAPTQDLVVPLTLTDGTTTAPGSPGSDYEALGSITVAAGSSSASAKLATTQDTVDEADETFTIGLGTLPAEYRAAGSSVTVTIVDDDPLPAVTLSTTDASVAEGGSTRVTASLSGLSSEDVTLDVSAAAVAPAAAADGSLGTSTTLTIPAGSTASTGTVTFTASQNSVYELSGTAAKTFTISAAASGGNGVADPGTLTLTLQDDESAPVVSITAGSAITEGSAAEFTLTASPRPSGDLPVSVTIAADGDFGVTTGARTVTIPATGTATLSVATTGDESDESDGSVTATVGSGTDYTPASTSSASVEVSDDDGPPPAVPVVSISAGGWRGRGFGCEVHGVGFACACCGVAGDGAGRQDRRFRCEFWFSFGDGSDVGECDVVGAHHWRPRRRARRFGVGDVDVGHGLQVVDRREVGFCDGG